jgi:hypothetical protein
MRLQPATVNTPEVDVKSLAKEKLLKQKEKQLKKAQYNEKVEEAKKEIVKSYYKNCFKSFLEEEDIAREIELDKFIENLVENYIDIELVLVELSEHLDIQELVENIVNEKIDVNSDLPEYTMEAAQFPIAITDIEISALVKEELKEGFSEGVIHATYYALKQEEFVKEKLIQEGAEDVTPEDLNSNEDILETSISYNKLSYMLENIPFILKQKFNYKEFKEDVVTPLLRITGKIL